MVQHPQINQCDTSHSSNEWWNHIIISKDAEKAFGKIQHPFTIKTLNKAGREGTYLNYVWQDMYNRPTAHVILNSKKLKAFPLRSGTKQRWPLSPLLFNRVLEVLARAIRQEKEIKSIQIWKKVKLSLFADDKISYIENPKDHTKLLQLINKFSTVAGYKINIQKTTAFLHTNNKLPEREIKKTIPFTTAVKRIKYLGINNPFTENCKTLMKEIEKIQINGNICHTHGLEELIMIKWPYYPKQLTDSCNPYQHSNSIFHRNGTNNLKICLEPQKTLNSQSNLKKNKAGDTTRPDFKLYYKAIVIKTVWYWHKNTKIDQLNRLERAEINLHIYGQLICDKEPKNIQLGKDSLFNKLCWENWTAICKRMKQDDYLTPYTKINSKWTDWLEHKTWSYRTPKDNIKGKLLDISVLTMIFWIWHLSKGNKNKINKWDYINLKMSAQQRKPSTIWKTNLQNWRNYFWNI